ncbi:MAG: PxxKW family cysteine-rich protein [Proteobacteria bacterium]|nr:PxxKW family cysteine-rich protein [Pseudomonadota bacterium]
MICQTSKQGIECFFMAKKGCTYNGGTCYTVIENCTGCERIVEYPTGKYCSSYPQPELKWNAGICNFASHVKVEVVKDDKKVNALKASKRKAAGKM